MTNPGGSPDKKDELIIPPLPEPRRVSGFFPFFDVIKMKLFGKTAEHEKLTQPPQEQSAEKVDRTPMAAAYFKKSEAEESTSLEAEKNKKNKPRMS